MFQFLLDGPRTVSAVAAELRRPLSLSSGHLRALEARGLLIARRVGCRVEYRTGSATRADETASLVAALRGVFRRSADPIETIFRLATAFTHPRRVEIVRVLHAKPQTLEELRGSTGISSWALLRHLKKLEARGFVVDCDGRYAVANRRDALGRELARLARTSES